MTPHDCPFTIGELLALYAIAITHGNPGLAAKLLAHSAHHQPTTEGITHD